MPAAAHSDQEPQSARAVLMVRPASFGFNPQTASSNAFQQAADSPGEIETQDRVLVEFDGLAKTLQRAGVEVLIAPDTPQPAKPDAIFPNNWVSFHACGSSELPIGLNTTTTPPRRANRSSAAATAK